MRKAINNGIKSINEHKFESTLSFYTQRAKKLDYLMDMSEINKRKDVFLFEDDIYEVYNDYGAHYPKELFIKYLAMLDELKLKRIENPSEISKKMKIQIWREVVLQKKLYTMKMKERCCSIKHAPN